MKSFIYLDVIEYVSKLSLDECYAILDNLRRNIKRETP